MTETNPYAAPEANVAPEDSFDPSAWPGLRRLPYWGWMIAVQFGAALLGGLLVTATDAPAGFLVIQVLSFVGLIALAVQRLRNIGNSGWWAVLLIVPLVNLFVGIRCAAYPTGYVQHKTMDRAGKILIVLVVLIPVIGILAAVALPAYQDYIEAANAAANG